ncbi:MAG: hypothetical protein K0B00_11585 [Rhodobacteraceae bacterium]|nr:hypothetical protein [Paracoccaceae bacterium]
MKLRSASTVVATLVGVLVIAGISVQAASWDSTTLKMNPVKGEAVAYDGSGCTAPGAQGYFVFIDKPGVTYTSVGWFNDKASCITIAPRTRVRIYQHTNFKGSTLNYENSDYDAIMQKELTGWWNDTLSSIKVWTMP